MADRHDDLLDTLYDICGVTRRPTMASPFGNPDAGLSGEELNMRCAFVIWVRDEGSRHIYRDCDVVYEDHNDEKLGHAFVEPEPEGRDY